MKRISLVLVCTILMVFFSMGGCGLIGSGVARLTSDFKEWPDDPRIVYEVGAESLAEMAAAALPEIMQRVADKQQGSFRDPVKVYAFASAESFSRYSGISEKARGASLGNKIYLSGLLLELPEEVSGMIGHELSHVQLSQVLGTITFNRTLPRWFREGLAIYVSDGGGAPRNFEEETIANFLEAKHFIPESSGALFNIRLKSTAPIGPRMFYSQSGMFVRHLAEEYPQQFNAFLLELQRGENFEMVIKEKFSTDVEALLAVFIKGLPKG